MRAWACTLSEMIRSLTAIACLCMLVVTPAFAQGARTPGRALLRFLPAELAGARAASREVGDTHLVHAAYRTETGFINVNLSVTRSVAFDRAQVEGAERDAVVETPTTTRRGIAIGRFRALYLAFRSGSETELRLFLEDRVNVTVSREGRHAPEEMVHLAEGLDLEGLARFAATVPAPAE